MFLLYSNLIYCFWYQAAGKERERKCVISGRIHSPFTFRTNPESLLLPDSSVTVTTQNPASCSRRSDRPIEPFLQACTLLLQSTVMLVYTPGCHVPMVRLTAPDIKVHCMVGISLLVMSTEKNTSSCTDLVRLLCGEWMEMAPACEEDEEMTRY